MRNIEIKRNFKNSKEGICVDTAAFHPEIDIVRHLRNSTKQNLQKIYQSFSDDANRFECPLRVDRDTKLARVLKYVQILAGKIKNVEKTLERDKVAFQQLFEKKPEVFREDLTFMCQQIMDKEKEIMASEQ